MSIEEEKSYPRGGVSSLKKRKRDQDNGEDGSEVKNFPSKKKKETQKEDLFGTSGVKDVIKEGKKKRKRVKKSASTDADEECNEISSVGDLSYGSLSVGMKVLGVVYSVQQYQVKFSLPGYLVASLPITKISKIYNDLLVQIAQNGSSDGISVPQLEDMLPEGTVLPLTIASIDKSPEGKYRVKVSAEPELSILSLHHLCVGTRLSGIISSIQDHGYTVDIGLKGVRAFLPSNKKQKALSVGEIVSVTLSAKDEVANTASLSLKSKCVAETPESIHSLIPGMKLNVAFKKKIKGGMMVSFGELEGVVPFPHYDMEQDFEEGAEMEATVLYIAPIVNVVYLTTNAVVGNLLSSNGSPVKAGELLEDCSVISVTPKGLYLKKTIKGDKYFVYVSPFESMDGAKNFKKLKETFPLNSKVKAVRLIQKDAITSVFIGSLKKDMIDIGLVSPKSLNVGDRVSAKIKSYTEKGAYVSLGRLQGFVRSIHLSNIPLDNPEVKFPVGSKLKCRVLALPGMNQQKKGFTLTAKPMLVKSDKPVIDSFDAKFLNVETLGVVVQVNSHGLLLELYGGAHGWVAKNELSLNSVEYPEKMFHIGQVINCKVKKVDEKKKKMLLTLILFKKSAKKKEEASKKKKCKMVLGSKYSCTVTKSQPDGLSVEVSQTQDLSITTNAFIPTNHLTDNIFIANTLRKSYSVGEKIAEEALFFSMDALPILTLKKSLLSHDSSSINSFEDVHIGLTLPGVVRKVHKSGPSVTFPLTKSSFRTETILLRSLSDFFVEDVQDLLSPGSTILVKVTDKNDEKESLQLTSKLSAIPLNQEVELVRSLLSELQFIRKNHLAGPLGKYEEGMLLSGKVDDKNSLGLFLSIEKGVKGVITNTNLETEIELDEASPMAVVVLFVDYENGILELTNKVDVVSSITLRKEKSLIDDYHVQARPLWSRDDYHYILMMVEQPNQFKGHLLKVSSRKSLNDWKGKMDELSFDKTYRVQIKDRFESIAVFDDPKLIKSGPKRKKDSNKCVDKSVLKKIKVPKVDESASQDKAESPDVPVVDMEDEDFNPWGEGPLLKTGVEEDGDGTDEQAKKKTHLSKSEAKALNKLEKEEIRRAEDLVIRGEEPEPQSKEDFEKLVLANPDSSLHWIQYIAFHADKGEHSEAKGVIKKALEKINFREEEERLNIYIAWFNLENSVGSEDEVEALLKEILKYNNEFKVYSRVSLIYSQTDKPDKAEEMLKMMARKFCKEMEVWSKLGRHYFEKSKDLKEARFTLQRALQNLEKRQHVEVTIKFAQMEFTFGEIERGKTIFETILSNYPKRIDIWNVYADTLVKASEIQATRDLFERMITLNLQPKKMKTIFKKYIDFETTQGDEFKVDRIKKKALEYVESKVGSLDME